MTPTLPLFEDLVLMAPATEGIKYVGSKLRLLPHILQLIRGVNAMTVLDAFSGTTRVSQALAKAGYTVVCNDIAVWSKVFGTCYLLNKKPPEAYKPLVEHLNGMTPIDGWFTEHYGGTRDGSDVTKHPWQKHNTRKLDAIREEIERLDLEAVDRAVALTSLILALDRVDSTLGHFVSYLRDWSPRSYRDMVLRVPDIFLSSQTHLVFQENIFDLIPRTSVDVAYLDPPYGSNNEKMPPSRVRYASYYHVWTSICQFDNPDIFGKANRRKDTSDRVGVSVFEEFRQNDNGRFIAVEALENLIKTIQARWIILSYSSGGRATARELDEVLRNNGRVSDVVKLKHKRNVMANMKWTDEWVKEAEEPNQEFLFLLEKTTTTD